MKFVYLSISTFILLASCNFKHQSVTISESLYQKSAFDKLIVIEPDFVYKKLTKDNSYKYFKSYAKDAEYRNTLSKKGKQLNINIEIYDKNTLSEDDVFYFNNLVPLKREMLVNLSKLDVSSQKESNTTRIFKTTPIIDPKYSQLMDKFGTKYFATTGVVSVKTKPRIDWRYIVVPPLFASTLQPFKETIFYIAIADVESGEIVYQEIRSHNENMTKTNMSIYVYDALKKLKKTIKKGK